MKFERMVSKIYFKFLIHTRCFLVREFKIYLFLYFYNNEYVDCDICFNGKYLKIYLFTNKFLRYISVNVYPLCHKSC